MKKLILPAIAAVFFSGVAMAQETVTLSGTVAERFGETIVLDTGAGRFLVTLPKSASEPRQGARLSVTGIRTDRTVAATSVDAGAQSTAEQPFAPTSSSANAVNIPDVLDGLGFTDLRSREDYDDGETVYSARSGESWLRAEFRRDGSFKKAESDGSGLPKTLVDRILPAEARSNMRLAEAASIIEVERKRDGKFEIEGLTEGGSELELEFDQSGQLVKFEIDERSEDKRGSLGTNEARARLQALGYTDIGWMKRGGKHVDAEASNAYGDRVEVRLNHRGDVDRERAMTR